ncbi:ABC transporter permease [Corynebacterium timonense]|uniref:ABC-2 type transport system permease protein n=1 Tax=Corynebacterium timonense TaxID=441500 RepID=A0A1H1RF97_9CORY|nr:ABC transporter permease [Corynebacterium timonense]SDS34343.1 ABC-2 type transport system permease protein [Corynebacterium timonense]
MSDFPRYSPAGAVATTAARESRVLLRTASSWAPLIIQLILIAVAAGLLAWQGAPGEEGEKSPRIALVDVPAAPFEETGAEVSEVGERSAAEQKVLDGEVDAAIVGTDAGWDLLSDGTPSTSLSAFVAVTSDAYSTQEALAAFDLTPEQFDAAAPNTEVTLVDLSEPDPGERSDTTLASMIAAIGVTLLLMISTIAFVVVVGNRVATEKSSHVAELLLTAVRPFDFLLGKILGTFIVAFANAVIVVAAVAAALALSGITESIPVDWPLLPLMLIPFSLSMLFFSPLYAAAGAMVRRMEDLGTTQTPILILLIASIYVPFFGFSSTDQTWMQVLSWLPPFSIYTAPVTYAAGDFTALQLAASLALSLAASLAVTWLAARVYRRTILNNGSAFNWFKAVRA